MSFDHRNKHFHMNWVAATWTVTSFASAKNFWACCKSMPGPVAMACWVILSWGRHHGILASGLVADAARRLQRLHIQVTLLRYPKHRSSIDILMEVQGSSSFPHRPKDQSLWRSISTSFPVAIRCEAFGIHSGGRGSNSTSHTNNGAIHNLVGGIPTPLKNISQLGWLFPIYGKIKNVPNHQPVIDGLYIAQSC